ncbi:acyloxyacyl hydrolase [Dyella choica]|nr:acyloxyacyl hydrolase [Dyella choica]
MAVMPAYRRLAAAMLLTLMISPAMAEGPRFSIEGGESFLGGYFTWNDGAPTVFAEAVFDAHPMGNSAFTWAPDITAGWIDGRDNISRFRYARYTTRDHIWMLAGGVRFQYGAPDAWYRRLFFSFQPSLHTGRTQGLSSSYEFTSTLGWQAEHWMLGLRHISNGFLHMPNRGENMLLVGVTF